MRKTLLRKAILGLGLLAIAAPMHAQQAPKWDSYDYINYIGTSFAVTAPAAIAGSKHAEISTDGDATNPNNWGAVITAPLFNVPVTRVYADSLGCTTPFVNGTGTFPSLAGKFVIIRRGVCEFGQKALNAQQAGAAGVIIANYPFPGANGNGGAAFVPGPGSVGSQVHIPVFMISDVDGDAIFNQINAGQAVTITVTGWQSGFTHDLAILPSGTDRGHAYATPISQLSMTNGNPNAYKMLTGAFIANFGTANEAGAKLVNKTTFTPTGGAATQVYADSVSIGTFATVDSVRAPFAASVFDPHPTTTGRYDENYTLSETTTDQSTADNSQTSTMYVTDSVFSKGMYDFTKNRPKIGVSYGVNSSTGTASDYVWGPLYYVATGGYAARKVQYSVVLASTNTNLSSLGTRRINLFRWVDANNDNTITAGEVTLVATASHSFSVTDSNRSDSTITSNWVNSSNPNLPVLLKDNSWYWVAADMPSGSFLGCDGVTNYYPRAWFESKSAAAGMKDLMYAPLFADTKANFVLTSTNSASRYPFESVGGSVDTVRFTEQGKGVTPNIVLLLSKGVVPSGVTTVANNFKNVSVYPNPASNLLNVDVQLSTAAKHVNYSIADGVGRTVVNFAHENVLNEKVSVPLTNLAAGQYYFIIEADESTSVKPFVIK